jgi:hypothetical protein
MGDISIKGHSPILRQGFAAGGLAKGVGKLVKKFKKKKVYPETEDLTHQKGPYIGDVGSEGKKRKGREPQDTEDEPKGFKKGGKADKKWIQKATASIKRRKTKGKCTPITKPGCTGRAKALAKTFKKMAKKRKAA